MMISHSGRTTMMMLKGSGHKGIDSFFIGTRQHHSSCIRRSIQASAVIGAPMTTFARTTTRQLTRTTTTTTAALLNTSSSAIRPTSIFGNLIASSRFLFRPPMIKNSNGSSHKHMTWRLWLWMFPVLTTVATPSFGDDNNHIVQCEGTNSNDKEGKWARLKRLLTRGTKERERERHVWDALDIEDGNIDFDLLASILGDKTDHMLRTGLPGQITGGFVAGWCAGYSLKKVGKVGAFVFGLGFCCLQGLSYAGYVHVDYNRVFKDALDVFDLNEDGKVDREDIQNLHTRLMEVLSYNIPAGSGFTGGFYAGVRSA